MAFANVDLHRGWQRAVKPDVVDELAIAARKGFRGYDVRRCKAQEIGREVRRFSSSVAGRHRPITHQPSIDIQL
jgi:hypothetical protein